MVTPSALVSQELPSGNVVSHCLNNELNLDLFHNHNKIFYLFGIAARLPVKKKVKTYSSFMFEILILNE